MNTSHPLAAEKYNATITYINEVTPDLWIIRIKADEEQPVFDAGQFVTIGLGSWESRLEGCQLETNVKEGFLGRRAYSVSSPVFDDNGKLCEHNELPYLELYIALVREGSNPKHTPYLTPRIFNLEAGDRLFLNKRAAGHYTLDDIETQNDVILLSTGTGLAPHNAMAAQLLSNNHQGKIVIVDCNRNFASFAYEEQMRTLEKQYDNVHYQQLVTREGPNP